MELDTVALVVACLALIFAAWAQIRTEQALRTGIAIENDQHPIAGPLDDSGRTFMRGTLTFKLWGPGTRYDVRPNVWPGEGVTLFPAGALSGLLEHEDVCWERAMRARDSVTSWDAGAAPIRIDYAVDLAKRASGRTWVGLTWSQPAAMFGFSRHGVRIRLRGPQRRPQVWVRFLRCWAPLPPVPALRRTPDSRSVFD